MFRGGVRRKPERAYTRLLEEDEMMPDWSEKKLKSSLRKLRRDTRGLDTYPETDWSKSRLEAHSRVLLKYRKALNTASGIVELMLKEKLRGKT